MNQTLERQIRVNEAYINYAHNLMQVVAWRDESIAACSIGLWRMGPITWFAKSPRGQGIPA